MITRARELIDQASDDIGHLVFLCGMKCIDVFQLIQPLCTYKSIPNMLTLFRLLTCPLMILCYLYELPSFCLLLLFLSGCISDYYDGQLARAWKVESNFGRFLDPVADKFVIITTVLLLFDMQKVSLLFVFNIVIRELFVSSLREYFSQQQKIIHVNHIAKWKTAIQMITAFLLLCDISFLQPIYPICTTLTQCITIISGIIYLF